MSSCNSKNFSGGYTPGPSLTGKGRGRKEGRRQGEGEGKEEGKKRERQGEGEGKRREGKGAMIGPPKRNSWIRHWITHMPWNPKSTCLGHGTARGCAGAGKFN
jgi:hypothetical protein